MFKDSEKIRAAIFDVDGTLLNSTPMWNKLTFAFAEKMGIAAPDDLFRTLNSLSLEQCAKYYHDVLHVEGTVEEIHEGIIALAREGYAKEVPEITGAAAFLKALSERHIPAAVATASDIASLRPAFDRLDMSPYISVIESCTTIGKSKEHPDIYLKCAADLKAAPHETVVFEDALYAAKTAKAAGFSVIGVLSEAVEPHSASKALRPLHHRLHSAFGRAFAARRPIKTVKRTVLFWEQNRRTQPCHAKLCFDDINF